MTHDFTHDPIKLKIVDLKSGLIRQTYVFVGVVPKDVMGQLKKLERNPNLSSSSILRKFYGAGWKEKLGVSTGKVGGAEFEVEDDMFEGINMASIHIGEVKEQADDNISSPGSPKSPKESDDQKESPDVAEELPVEEVNLNITDLDLVKEQVDDSFLENHEKTVELKKTNNIQFVYDVNVYPMDNIMDFKYKIFVTTGIPIYRQHLWFKYKARSYPASYQITIHKHTENIDIERLIAFYKDAKPGKKRKDNATHKIDDIEGIPVEIEYYKNKDFIHTVAQDSFSLLQTNYYKYSTTDYYAVDLNDLLKPTDIYNRLHKDKYQLELIYFGFVAIYFPMVTFSVFQDYLKNESVMKQMYPELLPSRTELRNRFALESKITDTSLESVDDKEINKRLFSSITQTIVSIDNANQDVETTLALRNLFDMLELDEMMPYCKANVLYENQNIILKKSFSNEKEPKDNIPINSLLIKIKTSIDTNENFRLIIFKNGNYVIKTEWREENHMDFRTIIRVVASKVNPIIKLINKLGDTVKYHHIPLVELTLDNAVFTETSLVFYYDDDTTEARFNVLKNILEDFRKARIITSKENVTLGYEYFFNKGMYKYDSSRIEKSINIDNYYDYLSNGVVKQKWETVFDRTRLFQIFNVSSKLKIAINGIRDDTEMEIFHIYLQGLLKIYNENAPSIKLTSDETIQTKSKKTLRNLKLQDPLLYDFKKIYKSNVIYSKICQKPYQPVILTDQEYSKLSTDKKSKAVKYWNFTKQKPAWYSCPNIKFPYIKFIVKQHPKDYCIPCCKKIAMNENVNQKKQDIHNTCVKAHQYMGEKLNLTKGSHYIASYGKNVEVGRISRLPENTLEPLFFDTYSPEGGIDPECTTADGYYIFGVEQNTLVVSDIGYLFCLITSLNMPIDEFLNDCAVRINKTPDKFRVLLDGDAGLYFSSVAELVSTIKTLNLDDTVLPNTLENLPWNLLFMSIAYYYYGVNTILFDDQQKEMIELVLPKGLKNPNEMFPESHKNLVVIRKKSKIYPIYLFNTELFKRTGHIDSRLFLNESGLITIIKAVVRRTFENSQYDKIKTVVDLSTIKSFANDNSINILHYYINYSNLCYAVILDYKGSKIYIPVASSHYPLNSNSSLIFKPYAGEYNAPWAKISNLLDLYHKWNVEQSNKAQLDGILLNPNIKPEQWLTVRGESDVIGFMFNNTNWFISNTNVKSLPKYPVQTLLYHPFKINSLLYSVKNGSIKIEDNLIYDKKLQKSIYDYYLYHLVLLHCINIFNNQRNTSLRKELAKVLLKTNFNENLETVREFILKIEDPEDVHKLKSIISRYVVEHHDKKKMIADITNAYFNFDKVELERIKKMKASEVNKHLHKLASKFVTYGTYKGDKFPNMFVACNTNYKGQVGYCKGNKLIIEKQRLNEILDILSHDIVNPTKWKWLFNSIYIEKAIDFFKFIRRKNETITVLFE